MSNPFTKPSIANYNANPPPDDGSTGADNEVSWSGTKTKLTDPIKDYADALNNNVFSAFGKRAFNAVSSISSSYSVTTADEGKLLSCSNTITITLPAAATATGGFMVSVLNSGSGTVTVDGDGAETINGSATLSLSAKQAAIVVSDGTAWHTANTYLDYGDMALKDTVATADIDDSAVTTVKINDAAVSTAKIADGAITEDKLASAILPSAITSSDTLTWYEANQQSISASSYSTVFNIASATDLVCGAIYGGGIGFRLTIDGVVVANRTAEITGADNVGDDFAVINLPYARAATSMKLEVYNVFGVGAVIVGWRVAVK